MLAKNIFFMSITLFIDLLQKKKQLKTFGTLNVFAMPTSKGIYGSKESICIHVGQAGVQVGNSFWQLLTGEHGIGLDGNTNEYEKLSTETGGYLDPYFVQSENSTWSPRAVFVDLEPTVIDEIRTGSFRNLYHPNLLINGVEDASNVYARGYYSQGRLLESEVQEKLRKIAEACENLNCITVYRALGGGTGSGFSTLVFDMLEEYRKISKVGMAIYPSPDISSSILEPYNLVMTSHSGIESVDMEILFDNCALYELTVRNLQMSSPSFTHINHIIAQSSCSATVTERFKNVLMGDLATLLTNLIPFPRIHFPVASISPLKVSDVIQKEKVDCYEITRDCFSEKHCMVKCNTMSGRYMSCCLIYRGEISGNDVYRSLSCLKSSENIKFVDWCPTGFKVALCRHAAMGKYFSSGNSMGSSPATCFMLANNSAIGESITSMTLKFKSLFSKRAFVHWYISEGMEEGEFLESLGNMESIAKDYYALGEEVFSKTQNVTENGKIIGRRKVFRRSLAVPKLSNKVPAKAALGESGHNSCKLNDCNGVSKQEEDFFLSNLINISN